MDRSPREEFIEAVCAQVRFTPARKQIADELRGHLEDRAAMLMEHGVAPEDAAARAAASMGDPAEIGAALDKEHSPFWGWANRVSCVLLGLVILFFCVTGLSCLMDDDGNLDTLFFYEERMSYGTHSNLAGSIPVGRLYETEHGWVYLKSVNIYAYSDGGTLELLFDCNQLYIRKNPRDARGAHVSSTPMRVYDLEGRYLGDSWLLRDTVPDTLYVEFGDKDDPFFTAEAKLNTDLIQRVQSGR